MVAEACAEDEQAIGLVHETAGDRRPAPTEHATTEGMRIGDEPLSFERRDDGGVHRLREAEHGVHVEAGAVSHDDHRAL